MAKGRTQENVLASLPWNSTHARKQPESRLTYCAALALPRGLKSPSSSVKTMCLMRMRSSGDILDLGRIDNLVSEIAGELSRGAEVDPATALATLSWKMAPVPRGQLHRLVRRRRSC